MTAVSPAADPDPLDAPAVEAALAARGVAIGRPLRVAAETGSTNDDAREAARAGAPHGAAFAADAQTRGRGRHGRPWWSPRGQNLYVSFVLRPALRASDLPLVPLAVGVAVADALAPVVETAGEPRVLVKWPNDVLVDGRKVAGVLVESNVVGDRAEWALAGVGVNVHAREFPEELRDAATSLALSGARAPTRGAVLVALCEAIDARLRLLERGRAAAALEAFRVRDYLLGHDVIVSSGPGGGAIRGVARGVDDRGRLVVRGADGALHRCAAGEATVRP